MPAATPFLIGAAVVGTVAQIDQTRRAGKAARAQAAAEQRRADIQNVQQARQAVRQARLAQAAITNRAALTGGMGSSGMQGGISSVGSQLSGNLNYMASIAEENTRINDLATTQARALGRAQVYGQVGQLANTIFSVYGSPSKPTDPVGKFLSGTRGSGD